MTPPPHGAPTDPDDHEIRVIEFCRLVEQHREFDCRSAAARTIRVVEEVTGICVVDDAGRRIVGHVVRAGFEGTGSKPARGQRLEDQVIQSDDITSGRSGAFKAHDGVDVGVRVQLAVEDIRVSTRTAVKTIIARAPNQNISATATEQDVVTRLTEQRIVTALSSEPVPARATKQRVAPASSEQAIVANLSLKAVTTCAAKQSIWPRTASEKVIASIAAKNIETNAPDKRISRATTREILDVDQGVLSKSVNKYGSFCAACKGGPHACGAGGVVCRISSRSYVKPVITLAANQEVIAIESFQDIVPGAAIQPVATLVAPQGVIARPTNDILDVNQRIFWG